MSATDAVRRAVLAAVAAAAVAVTLTGCGGAANGDVATNNDRSSTTSAPASKTADPSLRSGSDQPGSGATDDASPLPTLPPGDPGPDAPGTDDPNGDLGNEGGHSHHAKDAKTSVPVTAVLDVETMTAVAGVPGGAWALSVAPADSCTAPRPAKAVATRSSQLTGLIKAAPSQVVETVSTHHGAAAAVAAVRALERRLRNCHATSAPDPRIGDASVQLTLAAADGTVTVVTAVAVEGVTFVLSGSGPVTAANRWSALTDIALGSTCVATVEGCH